MRCSACGFDRYVVNQGIVGCARCGETAPYGFAFDQLVTTDDPCVTTKSLQRTALAALQIAFNAKADEWDEEEALD